MFNFKFEGPKSKPKPGPEIYHLSEIDIKKLRERTAEDIERERKEQEIRLAKEEEEREDTERVRRLLQQEEAGKSYVITEESGKEAEKLIKKL